MNTRIIQFLYPQKKYGSVLVMVAVSLVILTALGLGMLSAVYGVRHRAIAVKNEARAMLAAEAGYERAVYWMSQQQNLLYTMKIGAPFSDSVHFQDSDCDYSILFYSFIGSRPIYRIISNGHSGIFGRTVDVKVVQAIGGWDMGMCRVPNGASSTTPVYYADGEIIDMPIHINNLNDKPDNRDIYISGSPHFLQSVEMGESRYTTTRSDKYSSVMNLFDDGIYFGQPDSRISDEASVRSKVEHFKESTDSKFRFTPQATASGLTNPNAAVHLEFFVDGGVGKVRIANNCTVRGQQSTSGRDYMIVPGSGGTKYQKYDIYAYHVRPNNGTQVIVPIEDTYVTQSLGGVKSEPGGQIFVNGNVIIGSGDASLPGQDLIKGKVTIVATGNIWLADSTEVYGSHDADGKPSKNNPNALGLMAQGVTKIVDPGLSNVDGTPEVPANFLYVPIGTKDTSAGADDWDRHLPDPMVVEAAITVGGGGWGAENVGDRKEASGNQDDLILRGAISEAVRGVVGLVGSDGYIKKYYLDERLLEGVLPGDIWLKGKYIPAPAGWHDYRSGGRRLND